MGGAPVLYAASNPNAFITLLAGLWMADRLCTASGWISSAQAWKKAL